MRLYSYYRSSCSYRVRIALALKGLEYESVFVHLKDGEQHTAENLAINPEGLVPTLEDDGCRIGQSLAILEYLEERYPTPALLPSRSAERARVRRIALVVACDIQPLQNLRVMDTLGDEFGLTESQRSQWLRGVIERGLVAVEALLADSPSRGLCCHGDEPSLADVVLIPQVYNALRFDCDLSRCPAVKQIHSHCTSLDAFIAAAPEFQPDAAQR